MTSKARIAAALKALPPGTRGSLAPQASGMGRISPVQSEMYYQNPYRCLAPETRVLCSDFQWRPAGTLHEGDTLIAFDESPQQGLGRRRMRTAAVLKCPVIVQPCYRIKFTDGREITASADHKWLTPWSNWAITKNLYAGRQIMDLGVPWEQDNSWETGWLGGVFDGEASFSSRTGPDRYGGWYINFCQNPGSVLSLAENLLKERGYQTRRKTRDSRNGVQRIAITGIHDCFRFLGECKPVRLIEKSESWIEGVSFSHSLGSRQQDGYFTKQPATVESAEYVGDREVVAITTSTGTLFAEGLFSHNSNYGPFMPRQPEAFSDGAFSPLAPIQPVPVDQPPPGGMYPDPRYWQYTPGWNLPTPPGTEGLKLACYSSDTEILTPRGWLTFNELTGEDEVATRNPETRKFEWQKPSAHYAFPYDGELVHFTSRGIDLLVTPNHRVLHTSGHGKHCSELVKRADECELLRSGAMIATSKWDKPDLDWWRVPASTDHGYIHVDVNAMRTAREDLGWTREQLAEKSGCTWAAIGRMELGTGKLHIATLSRVKAICNVLGLSAENIIQPDPLTQISGDDFAAFIGAYVAEGCVSASPSGNLRIFLSQQRKSKGFIPYRELLIRMLGREPYYDGSSWTFSHDGLATYLLACGHSAPEKRLPAAALDLSARQLRILLDFYRLGDGWTHAHGEAFTTTSRELAGQVQEIAQKTGFSATVYSRGIPAGPGTIRGRKITSVHARYDMFLRTTRYPKWTATERVDYEGIVYCVTVPNSIVYVRRNGKAIWSGNSFDQLKTLSERYSVARACIDLRQQEIRGLGWEITLTKEAAKAYQGSHSMMKDFGERAAEATKWFRRPDRGTWTFTSFLNEMLEEIFVYDALCLIFRPKYGVQFGMGGRGLLGSNLDTMRLVPGPTIRPLVDLHGDPPEPPNPAYQQYLYGVPRSDYRTIMYNRDLDEYGLTDEDVAAEYRSDMMLYAPYWPRRESPYGFPPVEKALLPIVSGLQKQEFQLDYFKEGSVPAVYISPGDPNITPTQIRELQDALNGIAGDPAFHLKVVVLPPGAKVEPQRPIDLSDSFDELVMEQVTMAFDVQPMEIGIIPNIGGGQQGPSASAIRFASQEARDIKSRKSTKPLLQFICDIFNMILQDICGQGDMRFQFEGLADDEDKQAITELGVQQVQNGIASIDEVRDRLDLAPWGLQETSEPVVFTAQGPIPISMAPELIRMAQQNAGGGNSSSSSKGGKKSNNGTQSTNGGQRTANSGAPKTKQPAVRAGGQTKPNGSHPAPISPHRESLTPGHSAARGAIQSPTPRTGGTPSRSSVAGSRKKAVMSELESLRRHLRKDRAAAYTWEPRHIETITLAKIVDDLNNDMLIDVVIDKAVAEYNVIEEAVVTNVQQGVTWAYAGVPGRVKSPEVKTRWPGWEHDLGLVDAYKQQVGTAFKAAGEKADEIRKAAASGKMFVDHATLRGLIAEEIQGTFLTVLKSLWSEAWSLGYESGKSLATGTEADFTVKHAGEALDNFIGTEGAHWVSQVARTGLVRADARAEVIVRSEVARAMNAGAIAAYRDNGVTRKHLLVSPDDTCDICKAGRKEGVIPLDAIFPSGGLGGPFHPQCVIGSTGIAAADVTGASERYYAGKFFTIKTASGNELTATPNHPIATSRGWVPISELKVGDNVLTSVASEGTPGMVPNVDNIPAMIQDIAKSFPVALKTMPAAAEDFHGDCVDGDVYIVRANGLLANDGKPSLRQEVVQHAFGSRHVPPVKPLSFNATRDSFSVSDTLGSAANSYMGKPGKALAFSETGVSHSGVHSLRASSTRDSGLFESSRDDVPADAEGFCDTLLRFASDVALDKIADIKADFRGTHVYNLETRHGWYVANNIITHNCRCVPAPANVNVEPPQARIGKSEEDHSQVAFILYRSEADGKDVFLLQKRAGDMNNPGTWGLPGGTAHSGEDAWTTAWRESCEEMGDLPSVNPGVHLMLHEDERTVHIFVCTVPDIFTPPMDGDTQHETAGYGWFTRKEIKKLPLQPNFEEQWKAIKWDEVNKFIASTENGEMLEGDDQALFPAGARWPYPRRSDGAENPHYGTAQNDAFPSRDPARNTPAAHGPADMADEVSTRVYGTDETTEFPRKRGRTGKRPGKMPSQEPPAPQNTQGGPEAGVADAGSPAGAGPSGERKSVPAPHPVIGSVPAETPKPAEYHSAPPETYDPAEGVAAETDEGIGYYPQPKKKRNKSGPSDYSDPNPVHSEHVYVQMAKNFPPEAIEWVKRARWVGPVNIPWDRIDSDAIGSWAASKQPERVKEFEKMIKAHDDHVAPSVTIQDNDSPKALIIDGHHRALARKNLGLPVLSYIGMIDPEDRMAAEETHSRQVHSGSDKRNA